MAQHVNFMLPQPQSYQRYHPPQLMEHAIHQQNYNMPLQEFVPTSFQSYPLQLQPVYYRNREQSNPPPPPLMRIPPLTKPPLTGESSQPPFPHFPLPVNNSQYNPTVSQNQICNQNMNVLNTSPIQSISSTQHMPVILNNVQELISQFMQQNPDQLYQLNYTVGRLPKLVITPVSLNINSSNMLLLNNTTTEKCVAGNVSTTPTSIACSSRSNVNPSGSNVDLTTNNVNSRADNVHSSANNIDSYRNNVDSSRSTTNTSQSVPLETSISSMGESLESSIESQRNRSLNYKCHDISKTVSNFLKNNHYKDMTLAGYKIEEPKMASEKNLAVKLILNDRNDKISTLKITLQIEGDGDNDCRYEICTPENEANVLQSSMPEDESMSLSPIAYKRKGRYAKNATKLRKKEEKKYCSLSTPKKAYNQYNYARNTASPTRRSVRLWQTTCHKLQNLWCDSELNTDEEIISPNLDLTEVVTPSRKDTSTSNDKNNLNMVNLEILNRQNSKQEGCVSNIKNEKYVESDISSCETVINEPDFILQKESPNIPKIAKADVPVAVINELSSQIMSPESTKNISTPMSILKQNFPRYENNLKTLKVKNSEQSKKIVTFKKGDQEQNIKMSNQKEPLPRLNNV